MPCAAAMKSALNKPLIIVADTGPLISWARANQLPLLRNLLTALLVPPAVREELGQPTRPGAELLLDNSWLRLCDLPPDLSLDGFPGVLGAGERQAIALAQHLHADYLLMDDGRAVAEAEKRNLKALRTLRLLAQAKRLGEVTAVGPVLEEFVRSGFWLAAATRRAFLASVGEI